MDIGLDRAFTGGPPGPFGGEAFAAANPVPLPLPDAPALAGVEVALQWGVFTDAAPNGAFALSEARQLTLLGG